MILPHSSRPGSLGCGLAFTLSGLLVGATATTHAATVEPDKLFEKVSRSVVLVLNYGDRGLQGSGSGVVVDSQRIVTNCHVLRQAKSVDVKLGNARFSAQLTYPDPERDLCLLTVKDLQAPPVDIGNLAGVRVGQKAFAVGAPEGLELTLSDGLVSSVRGKPGAQWIQTSAPISHGSSGGGLFDDNGRLIGITTISIKEGQNLNFAIPADYIRELPERSKLALDKYREQQNASGKEGSAAPGTGTGTAPSTSSSASPSDKASTAPRAPAGSERALSAAEVIQHFASYSEFNGKIATGTSVKFELTWGDGFAVSSTSGYTERLTGTRSLRHDQFCLRSASTLSNRPAGLLAFGNNDCFQVIQTGAKSFIWRSVNSPTDSPLLSYTLP